MAEHDGIIYVPTVVLLEVLWMIEKDRCPLIFEALLSDLEQSLCYQIIPFDVGLLRVTAKLQGLELHDRIIVATAMLTNSVLVSKDRAIKARSFGINVVW